MLERFDRALTLIATAASAFLHDEHGEIPEPDDAALTVDKLECLTRGVREMRSTRIAIAVELYRRTLRIKAERP